MALTVENALCFVFFVALAQRVAVGDIRRADGIALEDGQGDPRPIASGTLQRRALSGACVLELGDGHEVDPRLWGLNQVMGPIGNLLYEDEGLRAAASTLGVGQLRHPGGTVANYWSLTNASYVDSFPHQKHKDRVAQQPVGTFSPGRFWRGFGSASKVSWSGGPSWVLNVFSLDRQAIFKELDTLKATGAPVKMIELGNELHLENDHNWQSVFPTPKSYMDAMTPIITKIRELFPDCLIGVAGNNRHGKWNTAIIEYKDLFDAVIVHEYGPRLSDLQAGAVKSQVSGWGDVSNQKIVNQLSSFKKEIWRTEFNYDRFQNAPEVNQAIPPQDSNGALAGMYWASHVLSAIRLYSSSNPITSLGFHLMEHQEGVMDDWLKYGMVDFTAKANDVQGIRFSGLAQIFAHFSAVALRFAGNRMYSIPTEACGLTPYVVSLPYALPCLQAAAFTPDWKRGGSDKAAAAVLLNKCEDSLDVELRIANISSGMGSARSISVRVVTYSADDRGGLAPLPSNPLEFPWPEGTLAPTITTQTLPPTSPNLLLSLPQVSLSFVTLGSGDEVEVSSASSVQRSRVHSQALFLVLVLVTRAWRCTTGMHIFADEFDV